MNTLFFRWFLSLLFNFIIVVSFSQDYNKIFYDFKKTENDTSNFLSFRIDNSNFFRNNEYFNNIVNGETAIGYYLEPVFCLASNKLKLEAGISSLKYFGRERFSFVNPIFSFRYDFSQKFSFVFGSLNGNFNHKLIEPIYGFDNYFNRKIEDGFQFLINNQFLKSDIWIDWQKFIFQDDPFQEEFTVGTSSRLLLFPKKFNVNLIFQSLVTHKGGQIDNSSNHLQTLINTATGIEFRKKMKSSIIDDFGFQSFFLHFDDLSFVSKLSFTKGFGTYNKFFIGSKYFDINFAYWNANHFIAPKGEILFQSVSEKFEKNYTEPHKELFVSKFSYNFLLKENIRFALRFESYFDILTQNFDYSYGFIIILEKEFFIRNLNLQ